MKYVIGDVVQYRTDNSIFAGARVGEGTINVVIPTVTGYRYDIVIKGSGEETRIREDHIISKIESPAKYAEPA